MMYLKLKHVFFIAFFLYAEIFTPQAYSADDPIQPEYKGTTVDAVDLAKSLRLQHKFDESIALLKPVIQNQPQYYRAMYQLALVCAERAQSLSADENDIANADKWFRSAIALHDQLDAAGTPLNEHTIYNSYGWFLIENGRFKEAETILLKAANEIEKLPSAQSKQKVLNNLAIIYKQQGRFDEAAALLKKASGFGSPTAEKNLIEVQQMKKTKSAE